MKLQDAFFNWLQMHIVSQARPDDEAAKERLIFLHLYCMKIMGSVIWKLWTKRI